ncbi:copper resistance protein B [Altererythrobacter sp.]|uniref:copper resistance protein B n=1 Tax=Altererythrobacter sp. TaxID=1872480 RepID=UPI003D0596EB
MRQFLSVCALPLLAVLATPAAGQDHSAHGVQTGDESDQDAHEAMDHGSMEQGETDHEAMDHGSMDHDTMDHSMHHGHTASDSTGPADRPGDAPPPPVPTDHAADAVFPPDVMARSRRDLYAGMRFTALSARLDMLEYRLHEGSDGYAFEGEAWYGGDIDRAVLGIEGEGTFGETPESIELDAFWRHAINPWFNLQLGARHDLGSGPDRSYAMVGIEGLAPYWIETRLRAFVSEKGDMHLRAEAAYDQRITQRLVLEPEVELDFALQDVPELGIGSGFDTLELSARLRYEIARNFAPYIGIVWERKLGQSADFARAEGEDPSVTSWQAGIRFWF